MFAAGSAQTRRQGRPRRPHGAHDLGRRSQDLRIDEIKRALFPVAASFDSGVDRETTIFTGVVHKDAWKTFADVALPQPSRPAFRDEDFRRIKDALKNALVQNLRGNNDEELGKERLQQRIFGGTPYGHPTLGSVAGLDAITLDDVKAFAKKVYTRAALTVGVAGDVPRSSRPGSGPTLAKLPAGPRFPRPPASRAASPPGSTSTSSKGDALDGDLVRLPDRRHAHAVPTSRRSRSRARGSASTAPRAPTSTSASARCAA